MAGKTKRAPKAAEAAPDRSVRIACAGAGLVDLDKLVAYQGNLKSLSTENYEKLRRDIIELGFSEPISCWKHPDGKVRILNGHQRVRTLTKMREEGWTVPPLPVSWVEAKDEREARMKVLSLTSQFGEITGEGLSEFMTAGGIEFEEIEQRFRFAELDLDRFWAEFGPEVATGEDPGANVEAGEALRAKWGTGRGQLWEVGTHRLMVGDSTDAGDVARLMGGERADAIVTSPPYNQGINAFDSHGMHAGGDWGDKVGRLAYDDSRPEAEYQNEQAAMLNVWHAVVRDGGSVFYNHKNRYRDKRVVSPLQWLPGPFAFRQEIIWSRPGSVTQNARMFLPSDERIYWLYRGDDFYFDDSTDIKSWSTVWDIRLETNLTHAVGFPLELPTRCIRACSKPGEIVADPYCGSGTTMVAAEQLGRRCFAMEIEPRYAAVILERMAGMGLAPKLLESRAAQAA